MVQYVLKRVNIAGRIAFEPPADLGAAENIKRELRKCRDKHNDYVLVTIQPPKRPRTTGKASQCNHFHGHLSQISRETDNDFEVVKYCAKMIAVEKFGYPSKKVDGHVIPQPEHLASTEEESWLIEAAHILAADLGIIVQE